MPESSYKGNTFIMDAEQNNQAINHFRTKRVQSSGLLNEIRKDYEKNFSRIRELRSAMEQQSSPGEGKKGAINSIYTTQNRQKSITKGDFLTQSSITTINLDFLHTGKSLPPEGLPLSDVYTLLSKIGEGGSSKVYLAKDNNLDILCVIKMILHSGSEEAMQKFYAEVKTTAKLRHPNIVNIFYANHIGEYFYYVMEYIDGSSCEEIIRQRSFSIPEVIHVGTCIAKALQYAHSMKIIHRDVKPANIIMGKDGTVKLLDLGLAINPTLLNTEARNKIAGTPYYLSPEQARAEFDSINETTDMYCFGATLYHILTGKVPFPGKHLVETITMVANIDLAPKKPSLFRSDISEPLDKIVLKCMDKRQDQRYKNMEQVNDELEKIKIYYSWL